MSLLRQPDAILKEHVHANCISANPFMTSLIICIFLSVLCLAIKLARSTRREQARSASRTPSTSQAFYKMPDNQEEPLPAPSDGSQIVQLLPQDPLAGVYFPITSGQLVALAEKRDAEGSRTSSCDTSSTAATQVTESDILPEQAIGERYAQIFEDKQSSETWQRKVLVYKRSDYDHVTREGTASKPLS